MRSEDKPEVNLENVQNGSDMKSLCCRGLVEGAHMSCWGVSDPSVRRRGVGDGVTPLIHHHHTRAPH